MRCCHPVKQHKPIILIIEEARQKNKDFSRNLSYSSSTFTTTPCISLYNAYSSRRRSSTHLNYPTSRKFYHSFGRNIYLAQRGEKGKKAPNFIKFQ